MAIQQLSAAFHGAGTLAAPLRARFPSGTIVFVGAGGVTARFGSSIYLTPPPLAGVGVITGQFKTNYPILAFMFATGKVVPPTLYKQNEKLIAGALAGQAQLRIGTLYKQHEQPIDKLTFAGAGSLYGRFIYRDFLTPPPFRGWGEAVFRIADKSVPLAASFAGSGNITPWTFTRQLLRGGVGVAMAAHGTWTARFGGRIPVALTLSASASFAYYSIFILHPPVPGAFADAHFAGNGVLSLDIELFNSDFIWPGIDEQAGSEVLFAQASGMEKALADTDAFRLTRMYAELITDQWNPVRISTTNLPYLAWATGVNLWEDWWTDAFRRYWVANQWTFKEQRGSLLGLKTFSSAVGGKLKRAVVPPAKTYLTPSIYANVIPKAATGTITFATNPTPGSTITFNKTKWTFVTTTPDAFSPQTQIHPIGPGATLQRLLQDLTAKSYLYNDLKAVNFRLNRTTLTITFNKTGNDGNNYAIASTAVTATLSGPTLTGGREAETSALADYFARFQQLRLYPYFAREQLRYRCFPGGHSFSKTGLGIHRAMNGAYVDSSIRKMFPTSWTAGGKYMRYATLYDPLSGLETALTVRQIAHVITGTAAAWGFTPGVSQYDEEVLLPLDERVFFYTGEAKFLGAKGRLGIYAGKRAALRTITISRAGPLPLVQGQITWQTIKPSQQLMELHPQLVPQRHPTQPYRLYTGRGVGQFIHHQYPTQSVAWRYIYERWYLFDPNRLPDYRKNGQAYLGKTRLGIHKYTAEAMIEIRTKLPPWVVRCNWYAGRRRFLRPRDTETVARLRRGVCASMAARDKVLINTKTIRLLQVRDVR